MARNSSMLSNTPFTEDTSSATVADVTAGGISARLSRNRLVGRAASPAVFVADLAAIAARAADSVCGDPSSSASSSPSPSLASSPSLHTRAWLPTPEEKSSASRLSRTVRTASSSSPGVAGHDRRRNRRRASLPRRRRFRRRRVRRRGGFRLLRVRERRGTVRKVRAHPPRRLRVRVRVLRRGGRRAEGCDHAPGGSRALLRARALPHAQLSEYRAEVRSRVRLELAPRRGRRRRGTVGRASVASRGGVGDGVALARRRTSFAEEPSQVVGGVAVVHPGGGSGDRSGEVTERARDDGRGGGRWGGTRRRRRDRSIRGGASRERGCRRRWWRAAPRGSRAVGDRDARRHRRCPCPCGVSARGPSRVRARWGLWIAAIATARRSLRSLSTRLA